MTEKLITELKKIGLHLNCKKTKILCSHMYPDTEDFENLGHVEINGESVQILHTEEFHRYLGRHICMSDNLRLEIEYKHRKQQAWASFHKHKKVLLDHKVSLKSRLHYFDVCVMPTILFA